MLRKTCSSAVSFVILSACAAAFAAGFANLWLDVPFVPQQKEGCGAASIAMVMQYWEKQQGQPVRPEAEPTQILHTLYSGSAHGIYASAMTHYFQSHGFHAFAFTANWMDVERQLHYGRPLIVAIKPEPGPTLHYVVVAGLDEPQHVVLVNDPAQRKLLKEDQSQFEMEWKATGNWALLAVPDTSAY